MGMTQLDSIASQTRAAAHNAVAGAQSRLRRDTSLVNQAHRLTGKAFQTGEEMLRGKAGRFAGGNGNPPAGGTVETEPPPQTPAADGYVRRSPVQPVHQAADYYRRLVMRGVGVAVLIAVACVGVYLLLQLGVFGR